MQAPYMTATDGAEPPIDDGLDNGPGKLFVESRNEKGEVKYIMFSGKPLRWRGDYIPSPEAYQETLRDKALEAQEGYVFHAEALRMLGVKVFRTGDYHIETTLRGKRDVVKFQTKELFPGGQVWTGPRNIAHLAFLSLEDGELPIFHFWIDPTIFGKKPDQMTLAETIDSETHKQRTEDEAKQIEDGLKMRLMPNITPSDQIWVDKLAEFRKLLADYGGNNRNQSLMDLMKKTFLEDQIRRLAASGEHSLLAMLQVRDQLLYFDNLDNGAFKGVKNNAATKFCMVYFGLPVEPLTLTNILNARKNEDDAREKIEPDYSILPGIYGAEADLEFLDNYHERAYGYPTLRKPKAKRPYKDIPEEVSDLIREQNRIDEELYPQPTRRCGGNRNAFRGVDSYDFGFDKPEPDLPSFKEFLALRGGARPSQISGDVNDYDDDDSQLNSGHFSDMEDVIMNDISMLEHSDGDYGLPSSLHNPSWVDGFDGGLRGGASPPRDNEGDDEEQSGPSTPPPNVNTPGTNTNNAALPPPASLPPLASMESVLATLQENPRQPPSGRRHRTTPATNGSTFDPSQFREYMVETEKNLEQDDLRVGAYHKAQSCHEPHSGSPEPPRYGKSVEEQLVTGPATPGVFANDISLAEVRRLQARNGELERLVLGRGTYCGMCDKTISFTTKEQRDSHFAGHVDGLHSCGFCGISFNSATHAERKSHLASHADIRYTKQAGKTPQRPTASAGPLAATPPASSSPAQVARATVMEGDTILYCQNCSVDLANFTTPAQLIQHTRACSGRNRAPSEPAYCKFCAIEISRLGSADDVTNHRNLCKGSSAGRGRQRDLWAAAGSSKDDRELTYWKLCALAGVPDLHYRPRNPNPRPYECRYSGCDASLLEMAKDGTLDAHHKKHISGEDRLKYICQANVCGMDLSMHEKPGEERLHDVSRGILRRIALTQAATSSSWVDHAHNHINDDEDELGHDGTYNYIDSDPPSDDDGDGGHQSTTGHSRQGNGANTGGGQGAGTRQTEGNNPARPPVPKAPAPKAPAPKAPVPGTTIRTTTTGILPRRRLPANTIPEYFISLPKEWNAAVKMLPAVLYGGSKKPQKSTFICPWHRSICPDGTKGCGVDNDDDLLIFSAVSAGRVRSSKTGYDQVDMDNEGAKTWGATQQLSVVSQYLARNRPTADKAPHTLLDPRFNTANEQQRVAGLVVRRQQANSEETVQGKAATSAPRPPRRAAAAAPAGQRPAKSARGAGGRSWTRAPGTPVAPPAERQGGGGLFVSPDT
ncbi:hypothetical protein VE04_05409 [Pseudogymnoascus sp. 24MN13]|nr:hypothetical protein VE04_05409 [Pseudogymnoascus sp. 24MN13]